MIVLAGGAISWSLGIRAQEVRRVGLLLVGDAEAQLLEAELGNTLNKLSPSKGWKIEFEVRSAAGNMERLPDLAAELVARKVAVIVALFTPAALAAKNASGNIPVVFIAGDAVGTGLVRSLSHPGGKLTGLSTMGAQLQGKCVGLLHEMLPSLRRVAALTNAADPFSKPFVEQMQLAGTASGVEIEPILKIGSSNEIDEAFVSMARARADAVVTDGIFATKRVADLALRHRLAAATTPRSFPEAGGLMSYGYKTSALYRLTALFVDKILRGVRPEDIPVEQPTEFELVINARTAHALGFAVPPTLLARADEVIE